MKTKTFDCVEMKRRGASGVQRRVAKMTPEQELDYWRRETGKLHREQQETQKAQEPSNK